MGETGSRERDKVRRVGAILKVFDLVVWFAGQVQRLASLFKTIVDTFQAVISGSADQVGKNINTTIQQLLQLIIDGLLTAFNLGSLKNLVGKAQMAVQMALTNLFKKLFDAIGKPVQALIDKVLPADAKNNGRKKLTAPVKLDQGAGKAWLEVGSDKAIHVMLSASPTDDVSNDTTNQDVNVLNELKNKGLQLENTVATSQSSTSKRALKDNAAKIKEVKKNLKKLNPPKGCAVGQCFAGDVLSRNGDGGDRPMANRQLGHKVLALLPSDPGYAGPARLSPAEANPLAHRAIWFTLEYEGGFVRFSMLRSIKWMTELGVTEVGSWLWFDLAEMGVVGHARVMAIEPCPAVEQGPGELVTAVFQHSKGRIWNVVVEGEGKSIGTTENHPFWSSDRKDFIPACELREGEWLLSERGVVRVLAVHDTAREEPVYNIEVEGDHCYRVGEQAILVHNASAGCDPCAKTVRRDTTAVGSGGTFSVSVAYGTDMSGKVLTYKTAGLKSSGEGADDQLVCRVYSLSGNINGLNPTTRGGNPQKLWGLLMKALNVTGQEAGHLAAVQFGGPDTTTSIVPMNSTLNVGLWSAMEKRITSCLGSTGVSGANYSVTVTYNNPGIVPSSFEVVMRFTGPGMNGARNRLVFQNTAMTGSFRNQDCFSQWENQGGS